eukprot:Hpha_TRINITY_DN3308_c0_g1::TRINITY_DN3308_c0_g1_i1::g.172262::m.172262/K21440/ANKRD50; ankyrin repeat domain-containing protein 50
MGKIDNEVVQGPAGVALLSPESRAALEGAKERHDRCCRDVIGIATTALEKQVVLKEQDLAQLLKHTRDEIRKVVKSLDAVLRTVTPRAGKLASRFADGIAEVDVDKGQCNFFDGASGAKDTLTTVRSALGKDLDKWVVCKACRNGIQAENMNVHFTTNCKKKAAEHKRPEDMFTAMTAEWACEEAQKIAGKDVGRQYIAMYSLNSPLCYTVGAAMRKLAFEGDATEFGPMKDFAYALHRAVGSLPEYEGTVFRAMNFRVAESLYEPGAIVTMPHATSASLLPSVVKDFLGKERGGGCNTGTILILRVQRGRMIEEFSKYPEEKEVLISTNTQFRVVGIPDIGVRTLLEDALETDLSHVMIVELREFSFVSWGDIEEMLTPVEKVRNESLLKAVNTLRVPKGQGAWVPDPVTGATVCAWAPLSTELPVVEGMTLLQRAVKVPRNESVVSLCITNLSPVVHAEALNDALGYAVRENQERSHDGTIAVLLSKGACADSLPARQLTADIALVACVLKWPIIEKVITALGDSFWEQGTAGWTVLHAAAANNRKDLLSEDRLLAPGKVSINTADEDGQTPCHIAAFHGHSDVIRALIKIGCDVNRQDNRDRTPCWLAADGGHSDALSVLIDEGKADVNKEAVKGGWLVPGTTPLYTAALRGHADVIRILLKGQADVNKAKQDGRTPVCSAAQRGNSHALRVLITEGHADVNMAKNDGATPCFKAAQRGHSDALRILIAEGRADVNKSKNDGRTPCFIAVQNGHYNCLRILIAEGNADPNKATNDGATPCYVAAEMGQFDCLRVLIAEGHADVKKPKQGVSPVEIARQNGHTEVLKLLEGEIR